GPCGACAVRKLERAPPPLPVGPSPQAVSHGELVFCSGQIPLDPKTGKLIDGEIEAQVERVMDNLRPVLEAASSGMDRVLRTTIYVTDLSLFARVNRVYGRYFQETPPARATVQVAALPLGALVEIDCIAMQAPKARAARRSGAKNQKKRPGSQRGKARRRIARRR